MPFPSFESEIVIVPNYRDLLLTVSVLYSIGCFIYKVRKSSQRQNLPSYAQREAYEVEEVREVNDILNPRFMSY